MMISTYHHIVGKYDKPSILLNMKRKRFTMKLPPEIRCYPGAFVMLNLFYIFLVGSRIIARADEKIVEYTGS